MDHKWLLLPPIILQTILAPESSIASWVAWAGENGLNKLFIFPIVFVLGNLIISSLFWPKIFLAGPFVAIYRLFKKSHKVVHFFNRTANGVESSVNKMLNYLNAMEVGGKGARFSVKFYFFAFLADALLGILLFWRMIKNIFINLILFFKKISRKMVSRIENFGQKTKKTLVKAGYAGIIIGAVIPLFPGGRPGGVAATLAIGTNKAKITFFAAEAVRIILEILFAEEIRQLIGKVF